MLNQTAHLHFAPPELSKIFDAVSINISSLTGFIVVTNLRSKDKKLFSCYADREIRLHRGEGTCAPSNQIRCEAVLSSRFRRRQNHDFFRCRFHRSLAKRKRARGDVAPIVQLIFPMSRSW